MDAKECYRWLHLACRLELWRRTADIAMLIGFLDLAAGVVLLVLGDPGSSFDLAFSASWKPELLVSTLLLIVIGITFLAITAECAGPFLKCEEAIMEAGGYPAGNDLKAVDQSIGPGIRRPVLILLSSMALFLLGVWLCANGLFPSWLMRHTPILALSGIPVLIGIAVFGNVFCKRVFWCPDEELWLYCQERCWKNGNVETEYHGK